MRARTHINIHTHTNKPIYIYYCINIRAEKDIICEVQLFEVGTQYTIKCHYIDPHPLASVWLGYLI